MNDTQRVVVSIGRQFGSGGRVIGRKLAERLSIKYYDKELMTEFAKDSGFDSEVFERSDERHSWFEGVLQWMSTFVSGVTQAENYMSSDSLFRMQAEVIQHIAERESCVIVGRCSDYILRNNDCCFSVFLHASDADRAKRIAERMQVSEGQALAMLEEEDNARAGYYNYYTSKTWGMASSYDICLNVSLLGEDGVVDMIVDALERRLGQKLVTK